MDDQILLINTRIPARVRELISRPRLVEEIERGLGDAKIVLISAPAGFGKTALLTDWAHVSTRPIAWVNVEPMLNDPERLLRHLVTAWGSVDPELPASPAGLLLESNDPDPDLVTRALANYALLANHPITFALDDVHLIQEPDASRILAFLIEQLPADVRFVCATRSEPNLPLSRLRVRQHMKEIGAAELAFGLEETKRLFARARVTLSDDDLALVQDRCEGWVAGLQLMAQSSAVQSGAPVARMGNPREITDYLSDEVLALLDEQARQWLVRVGMLDQLCASLCDAVTAGNDSRSMLDRLERANLFLQPLDAERTWYRLHPLMRVALRCALEMTPEFDAPALHARAGHWFYQQGMIDEAFHHAVAGGEQKLATRIAESYTVLKLESGEFRTIRRWVEAVPEEWYRSTQELNFLPIALSVFSGNIEAGLRIMDEVEARLDEEGDPNATRLGAKMAVGRCAIACFRDEVQLAETYAARALRDLDDDDVTFRANTHHALADTYRRHGRWDEARRHYLQVLEFVTDPSLPHRSAHVYGALADLALRQGHLHEAATLWRKDIASIQRDLNWGKLPAPIIGWAYIRHGELLYEWNRVDDARSELERGLERAELGGDARALIAGYLLAARLRLLVGDSLGADGYLQRAEELVERAPYPEWLSNVDRSRALVWIQRGDSAEALAWCRRVRLGAELRDRPDNQAAYLGLAHLLIAFGAESDRAAARAILADQHARAEAEGRLGVQAEALALEALARHSSGYENEALVAIERALQIAEPEGPMRLFLDLGAPLLRLLQRAEARSVLPAYGQRLLEAADDLSLRRSGQPIEQLSDRESEILRLVAAGLTNREAGERLFISDETVKKHLANIYGKLAVHRRTEAAARARELGLLR